MSIETTYDAARANFDRLWDRVTGDGDAVTITRRGHEDVALISARELRSLQETAHLLRSPSNRERLLAALRRADAGEGALSSVQSLREEVGLGEEG